MALQGAANAADRTSRWVPFAAHMYDALVASDQERAAAKRAERASAVVGRRPHHRPCHTERSPQATLFDVDIFDVDVAHILFNMRQSPRRCRCAGCARRTSCGQCKECLDKPRYGGTGKRKRRCLTRQCEAKLR